MEADDATLLRAWKAGNADAGNQLFRRHFKSVYRFFRSKLDTGADDLTQRTFLAALEAADRFRGDSSFKTFLIGIARKKLLMHFRGEGRKPDFASEVSIAQLMGPGSPSTFVRLRQEQAILLRALRQLPIDLQVTVELYYWERMPVGDIGEVLGVPAGTIKSRLARARERLQTLIDADPAPAELRSQTVQGLEHWATSLRDSLDTEPDP